MVSTLTATPACLPNASAYLRNSSSEAGTKWFQLRNVSSRFWANAGAFPSAIQDAMPAVALEATRRKRRRVDPCIRTPCSARLLMGKGVPRDQERSHLLAADGCPVLPPMVHTVQGTRRST